VSFDRIYQENSRLRVVDAETPVGYTPGDRFPIDHGFTNFMGAAVAPSAIIPLPLAADADGALTATVIEVVTGTITDTEVEFRSDAAAETAFKFICIG
jgi:hypothetical protein